MANKERNFLTDPETYECPVLVRKTCMGECYDIQMVRGRSVKKEILNYLDHEFDFEKADEFCEDCPYNQLPGVRVGQWKINK